MKFYRWVTHEGQRLYAVGVGDDGQLHNPNGYPEELVRAAVAAADERWMRVRVDGRLARY